jgi:hypothetical protein
MPKLSESNVALFILGAFVGIYGNWLVSFFDKLQFSRIYDFNFFALFFLSIGVFVSFSLYLITAFRNVWNPSIWIGVTVFLTFICLLFPGAIPSNQLIGATVFWMFGVAILFSILAIEWAAFRKHVSDLKKRWKKKKPKIGIINDMQWDVHNREISNYTDVSPEQWRTSFDESNWEAVLIDSRQNFDDFVAILNPYGGVYPESSVRKLTNLQKIMQFVEKGGIFVNIADIPTYWAYDPKLQRMVETTKPVYTYNNNQLVPVRLFESTPLMKEVGLSILNIRIREDFGNFSQANVNIYSERFAIRESNVHSLIRDSAILIRPVSGNNDVTNISYVHLTGFFIANYGEGDFLFSLAWLHDGNHTQQDKDVIRNAIVEATTRDIREKIRLHEQQTN